MPEHKQGGGAFLNTLTSTGLQRRTLLRVAGAGVGGAALSPFLASLNRAFAAVSCNAVPADKSGMDYTFTAADAGSRNSSRNRRRNGVRLPRSRSSPCRTSRPVVMDTIL